MMLLILFAALGGALLALTVASLRDRWHARQRHPAALVECYYCGTALNRPHVVVSRPNDDVEAELASFGGTAVVGRYCAEHCPGGCNRKCARMAA